MTSVKLELFFILTLAAVSSEAGYTCGPCMCYDGDLMTSPGFKIAHCWYNPDLTTVPDLPDDLQVLYIFGGSISKLSDSQFISHRRLQRIQIVSSNIEQIEQGSFRYMTNVKDINLSANKISELPNECFTFSPNLITVDIHNNIIARLQTHLFSDLKYLKEVDLNNNIINTIEEHCFDKVPQLEKISLFNNELISLDLKFLDNPSSLKTLYLHDNPWHCDTSLCGVMDTELWWVDVPTCRMPRNLTKRQWSTSLLTELCSCLPDNCTNILMHSPNIPPEPRQPQQPQPSCDAPLIISNTSSVSEGQDLRLTCNYCLPSQLVWTFNDTKLPSNYVENSEESLTSTLTITNVMRGQQGYYLCKIRSCEDCADDGVYVSVTGKPQTHIDIKQVVPEPQPACDAPLIISNTSSVSEGQDLRLTCNYCLPSRLVWSFNDVKLPSRFVQKSEESLTSTLTIKNILREQRGYYLCKIRSCEDCEDDGVYVSVTGKPQSDVDFKQVVHIPGVNSSESCGSRSGILIQYYTVVPATELNTTLSESLHQPSGNGFNTGK